MDADFEILLPADAEIKGLPFKIPYFEWDGINYPQGPPECKFGSNFELKFLDRYPFFDHIESKLPRSLRGIKWQPIVVQGKGLDLYVAQQFGFDYEEEGYSFKDLLYTLLSPQPIWLAILSPQSDGFDTTLWGDLDSILTSLDATLKEPYHPGFMICHKPQTRINRSV
jgi:hypothetical protein